jgi:hypothetical protein
MPETHSSDGGESPDLLPSLQATSSGDSVEFVFQITNTTEHAIGLEYSSGQSFDFVVTDDAGAEIWRWSGDRMFTQALRNETLAAGETLTFRAGWTPPPGVRGNLLVAGTLTAMNVEIEQRASFAVP